MIKDLGINPKLWHDVPEDSNWKYVITDMQGRELGEVQQAHNRTYADPLKSMRQGGFAIATDNPLANPLLEQDTLMKIYKRPRAGGSFNHLMTGDVIQAEEQGDGNTSFIAVVGADPLWRLMKRLIGMTLNAQGVGQGISLGFHFDGSPNPQNIGSMLLFVLNILNTVGGNTCLTGCQVGTAQPSVSSSIGPLYATFFGQLLQDACASLGAPDFAIEPIEPFGVMPNTNMGVLNFYTKRGSIRLDKEFEYGIGQHNVQTYSRLLTKQNAATIAWGLPQGFPSAMAKGDFTTGAINVPGFEAIGWLEDLVGGDVVSPQLRKALCDEHVAVRGGRQQQITFQPRKDCNIEYNIDYFTGDVVGARAYVDGDPRYDGSVRIYNASVQVDDNDSENVTLTLIDDGSAGTTSSITPTT